MGSRQVLAVLLRAVGQSLETWADRLEAAITQVTATLPDPRVRKDLFAKLWRVWLTIVAQITQRLPVRWRAFVAGLLPILVLGSLVFLGIWTNVFHAPEIPAINETNSTHSSPSAFDHSDQPLAPPVFPLESTESPSERLEVEDLQESEDLEDADTQTTSNANAQDKSDRPQAEITTAANTEVDSVPADPLGPPLPNWSTLSSPLEQKVKAKLVATLSPSWRPVVQRLQVNFNQQELTVYLSDQWQTLTSADQHRLLKTLQQQARQLDFPHLRFLDEQNQLLARTAIVGEGIIFQTPP